MKRKMGLIILFSLYFLYLLALSTILINTKQRYIAKKNKQDSWKVNGWELYKHSWQGYTVPYEM
jgi:hypothetical protein